MFLKLFMSKVLLFCVLSLSIFIDDLNFTSMNTISTFASVTIESTVIRKRLFVIERNMNKNTVCYDVNIKNGSLDQDNPIDAYWIDYATDGKRSELNYIQRRMAYGYSYEKANAGNVFVTLKAFDKRKILVSLDIKGNPRALLKIAGVDANLSKIFVTAKPKMYTNVEFIELYGMDIRTGKSVYEKIQN
jgi:hypothetical protein